MKFVPDFLKKKPRPDPTNPETLQASATAAEDGAEKKGFAGRLRERFFGAPKKQAAAPASVAEAPKESEGLSGLEKVRNSLSSLVNRKKTGHKVNTVLIVAGAGVAVAGMAADMMFLGGAGTLAVLSMVYSDFRNAQHIRKITGEIGKIDEKIDELKKAQQPVPDFSPALSAVKSSIEDFQASAKKVPPEVAEDLENLRRKVEALQEKIAPANPANDDAAKSREKPAAPGM